MQTYNVVDLFAGAGGLSLGFIQTGKVHIVAAAENNPNARKTYKRNHKVPRLYSDVRTIDYGELLEAVGSVDVVIGGPPCQGFSNANRQHTSIISMNNRLVKEYVRAILELKPRAFVMENVAMLKSQIHRFMVEEKDLDDARIMEMDLTSDEVELLPASSVFDGAMDLITSIKKNTTLTWADSFYKIINLLYRYRINQDKFDKSLDKYLRQLTTKLNELMEMKIGEASCAPVHELDKAMAERLIAYIADRKTDFAAVVEAMEAPLYMQRAISRMNEIIENDVHVFEYKETKGSIVAVVKSYAVLDYIKAILGEGYTLKTQVLNAIHFGAPQRRERFIVVGVDKNISQEYEAPKALFEDNFRTVRDAIEDLESVPVDLEVTTKAVELPTPSSISELGKELRGRLLHNHIATATQETAMARFKALKAGQNFHDLDPELKTTYSNAERTQNTIYMRLKYDEPSGTVVNVRKSMWIHPVLDRAVSIREAARLQTFPDNFVFEGTKDSQYQQIGNAVPPYLARAIAKSVFAVLDAEEE